MAQVPAKEKAKIKGKASTGLLQLSICLSVLHNYTEIFSEENKWIKENPYN